MQVYLVDGRQYNISTGISSSAAQILFSANLAVCVLQSSATATHRWAAHLHFLNVSLALLMVIASLQLSKFHLLSLRLLGLQMRCLSLFGKSLVALTSGLYRDDLICNNLILLPQALQANRKLELSETAIK